MNRPLPSQEELSKLLRYEPETGKLFWLPRPVECFPDQRACSIWNTRYAGQEAFITVHSEGYRKGGIFGVARLAHRVIWRLVYGDEPNQIDHINGDRADNRLENLRGVSSFENCRNKRIPSDNSSGVVGVSWFAKRGKWVARGCSVDGRQVHIGIYKDFDAAVDARKAFEQDNRYHENHGRAA